MFEMVDPNSNEEINKEHLALSFVHHEMQEFEDSIEKSFLHHILAKTRNLIFGAHHYSPVIDTSSYKERDYTKFPKPLKEEYSVYALKKIKVLNPHFFKRKEQRILSPAKPGPLYTISFYTLIGASATSLYTVVLNKGFSKRNLMTFAFSIGALAVVPHTFLYIGEQVKQTERIRLARKYMGVYGDNYLLQFVSPKYDIEKIRHLENKLNAH